SMKAHCQRISSAPTRLPWPAIDDQPHPSRPLGTGPARIIILRLLGIALVAMTSLRCSPYQTTAFVPRTDHECRTGDPDVSQSETVRLTNELAEQLPNWSSTISPSV